MNYLKGIDEEALIKDILSVQTIYGNSDIFLTMNEDTEQYFENKYTMHIENDKSSYREKNNGILGIYHGYRIYKDDNLSYGEIKIFTEVK